MTSPGRYASPDGSFGRSTGNAAARGGGLILVAVVIGLGLLWKGGVGGDSTAVVADTSADTTDGGLAAGTEDGSVAGSADGSVAGTADGSVAGSADGSVAGTADGSVAGTADGTTEDGSSDIVVTPTTRPAGEVKAAVANGVGEDGLAGARTQLLKSAGYVSVGVNAAATTALSAVYYIDGYGLEASGVATELGGTDALLRAMPADPGTLVGKTAEVEGFHVIAVLGTDRVLG